MSKDYYAVLGVEKTSTEKEIKKKYKKLVMEHHPDKGGDPEKFTEIAEAYEVLGDESKRKNYDTYGSDKGGSGGFNPSDFENMFNEAFKNQRQRKGSDIRVSLKLNIREVFSGLHKKIKYKRKDICVTCKGEGGETEKCNICKGGGFVNQRQSTPWGVVQTVISCTNCGGSGKTIKVACGTCDGFGTVDKEENVEFNIPKGIFDSEYLSIRNKGNSVKGGVNGDLIINIVEIPDEKFIRRGLDITQRISLSYKELVIGTPVEVETLDGRIRITVKDGTPVGHILRVPRKGLSRDNSVGDMLIELWLNIPTEVTEEEKVIINQL